MHILHILPVSLGIIDGVEDEDIFTQYEGIQ
jgi:hypothetical protein